MPSNDKKATSEQAKATSKETGVFAKLTSAVESAGYKDVQSYMATIGDPRSSVGLQFQASQRSNLAE